VVDICLLDKPSELRTTSEVPGPVFNSNTVSWNNNSKDDQAFFASLELTLRPSPPAIAKLTAPVYTCLTDREEILIERNGTVSF
jgi:hypothetical protein